MLEAAINKILSLAAPNTCEIKSSTYTDKKLARINNELYAQPLMVHTLSSIIDYIENGTDDNDAGIDLNRRFVLHINDYDKVTLCRELSTDKVREELIIATNDTEGFPFGHFLNVESFIIAMQAYFLQDDTTAQLIRLVSNVTDSKSVQQSDDGMTQRVTARTGIIACDNVVIPNPVNLRPICTFTEAVQPERRFIFRLRGGDDGVTAALFKADGNAWKNEAIQNIRKYFENTLPENMKDEVIILA